MVVLPAADERGVIATLLIRGLGVGEMSPIVLGIVFMTLRGQSVEGGRRLVVLGTARSIGDVHVNSLVPMSHVSE